MADQADTAEDTFEETLTNMLHRSWLDGRRNGVETILKGLVGLHEQAPEVGFDVAAQFVRQVANGLLESELFDPTTISS